MKKEGMNSETRIHEILMDRPGGMTVREMAVEIALSMNGTSKLLTKLTKDGLAHCIRGDKHIGVYCVPEHLKYVEAVIKANRLERRRERERNRMRRRNSRGTSAHEARMAAQRAKRAALAAERALLNPKPPPIDMDAIIDPPIIKRVVPAGEWSIALPIRCINSVWALAA